MVRYQSAEKTHSERQSATEYHSRASICQAAESSTRADLRVQLGAGEYCPLSNGALRARIHEPLHHRMAEEESLQEFR